MKEVDICTLANLKELNPLVHTESDIYYKGKKAYKIYIEMPKKDIRNKERKIEVLNGMTIKHAVLPKEKIIINNGRKKVFLGYSMDFIRNSKTLYEYSSNLKSYQMKEYLNLMRRISFTLRNIHNRDEDIVLGDSNFYNILLDKDLNYYFIDLDGSKIGNIEQDRISGFASDFYKYKRLTPIVDRNFDRLTMLIYFLDSIFNKNIFLVSGREFDRKSEKIKFLKEIKSLVIYLNKVNKKIPYVPYIDEFVPTLKK